MATSTSTRTRKGTKFHVCQNHSWLNSETRRRRAAFFVEGGPADDKPCTIGDPCRLWPGTDLFNAGIADGAEFPLNWAVSR